MAILTRTLLLASVAFLVVCGIESLAIAQPNQTALDEYIHKPDSAYRWKTVSRSHDDGLTTFVIDMVSQSWRDEKEVDRTLWQHWLIVMVPDKLEHDDTALLFIGGGSNGGEPPTQGDEMTRQIALQSHAVVADLKMVPNQRLEFHSDGHKRNEDDLIAYTWLQYLKTGDPDWPARNPMVKSAVRAMDTISALMASKAGGNRKTDKFVVAGGSKRGWTTWLSALDNRVVAIAPIVIDVLNLQESMRHHYSAYGFWAPSVGDYTRAKIFDWFGTPQLKELQKLVDPYYYRHRLKLPKYIVNAAGDQFFLPDSSQFYFDDLIGEKMLRYVPNGDHSLAGTEVAQDLLAFFITILKNKPRPSLAWKFKGPAEMSATPSMPAAYVLQWVATNPNARDFRVETLGKKYVSKEVKPLSDGSYVARVSAPEKGWRAYFLEFHFDLGIGIPYRITTPIRVIPDVLPFKDKSFQSKLTAGN